MKKLITIWFRFKFKIIWFSFSFIKERQMPPINIKDRNYNMKTK